MQIRAFLLAGLALTLFACIPSPLTDLDAGREVGADADAALDTLPDTLDVPEVDLGKDPGPGDTDVPPPDPSEVEGDADALHDVADGDAGCCASLDCEAEIGASTTCRLVSCDPLACQCTTENLSGSCDDGSACTSDDQCTAGACGGTPVAIDDTLSCTDDACDPASGAVTHTLKIGACLLPNADEQPTCYLSDDLLGEAGADSCWACKPFKDPKAWSANAGFGCDDLNPCTVNDTCGADGACTGNDLGDLCLCDDDAKCLTLDDGNLCNGVPTCNDETHKCEIAAGAVVTCDPSGDTFCAQNRCVPETGACELKALHLGESCDDADACTAGDTCVAGACLGAPASIDDGLSCTDDACDPVTGTISHAVVSGFCRVVEGEQARCVADGLMNVANVCLYCDTSLTSEAWSNNDGAACYAGAGTLEGVCVNGVCAAKGDLDGDDIDDELDNCPTTANADQADFDDDGAGDACDDDDDDDDTPDTDDCRPFDGSVHPGADELCNGHDDDCDNATDQADSGLVRPACDKQEGVCAGAQKPAGLCVDGVWKPCTSGTYLDHDERYQPGSELSCDEADNNCDGGVDEGFTYLGSAPGVACGGSGACGAGVVECASDGKSALCSTNPGGSDYNPGTESCNDADDDCDGLIDEGLGVADSPCSLQGVCDASNVRAACTGGAWSCDYASVPHYEAGAEGSCDDLDNDCDGQIDEDFTLANGGSTLRKGDACGAGGCLGGVVICNAGGDGLACSTDLGGVELCDGKDNDCDGQTDEDLAYLDPQTGAPALKGEACEGRGECGPGVVECGSQLAITCSTNPQGSASEAVDELCDGKDNDCDGASDEGLTWEGIALGDACEGTGECGEGVVECSLASDLATCSTLWDGSAPEFVPETCNGKDDDCSGTIDDELTVYQSPCKLTGVCTPQQVVAVCQPSGGWSCSYAGIADYVEGNEAGRCDGKDNDCDGLTDEDFTVAGAPLGSSCDGPDADQCARGTVGCTSGGQAAECAGDVAQNESCNGKDDDCDGQTDEADASNCTTYYRDVDGDTWGTGESACLCAPTPATDFDATRSGDCDDASATINPDAAERCNGKDDDCDAKTDGADLELATDDVQPCETQTGVCAGAKKPVSLCVAGAWGACTSGIYSTHDAAYQAGAETSCDGKDNDCSGQTDEDFTLTLPDGSTVSGVAKPCGTGLCAGGQTACIPAGTGLECSTSWLAVTEVCNLKDDDCDGKTDAAESDLADTDPQSCEKQAGVCSGSKKSKVLCVNGAWATCADAQYQSFSPLYEAGAEVHCDGKDNDCNGQTDEDFALTLQDGTTVTGAGKACGVGVCANGTTACDTSTLGIRCPSEANATTEVCDTKDNDCDAKTDKTDPTLELTACEKQQGVCSGSKHLATQCGAGSWTPCTTAEYTTNNGEYEATTEVSCDNLDNDCDGQIDDDFTWLDPNDGKTKKKGDACGTGACAGSVVVCNAAGTGLVCSEASGSEVCGDGIDNDCDGATDEEGATNCVTYYKDADRDTFGKTADFKCLCAKDTTGFYDTSKSGDCDDTKAAVNPDAPETCNGLDDDCDGKTDATDPDLATDDVKSCEKQAGVCSGSKKPAALCASGAWGACATATYTAWSTFYQSPAETSCDARDNDCDGATDDDFTVTMPDGTTHTGIGKVCGTGACTGGTTLCKTDQLGIECSTSWKAATETCDKVDNDCDGKTDATDPTLSLPNCEKQAGVCAGSKKTANLCSNGLWSSCTDAIYGAFSTDYQSPLETSCDGKDNNCDFETDHEFVAATPEGSFYYGPGQACGVGACAGGVTECTADKLHLLCSTTGLPPYPDLDPEVCNGLDDDCDGKADAADPDLPTSDPQACELQAGVCAGSAKPVSLCLGNGWAACGDDIYAAWNDAYSPEDRVGGRCWSWSAWSLQGDLPDPGAAGDDLRLRVDANGTLHVVSYDGLDGTVVHQTWGAAGPTGTLIAPVFSGAHAPSLDLQADLLPVVAYLGAGNASVWLARTGDSYGADWTLEQVTAGAAGQFSSPAVIAEPDGVIRVAWIDSGKLYGASRDPSGVWETPNQLRDGSSVREVIGRRDPLGRLHLLFTEGSGTLVHLQFDGRDAMFRTVMSGLSDLWGIGLAIDADNVLHVAAYDDGSTTLYYATDATGEWRHEVAAYDAPALRPTVAVSPEGRVLIAAGSAGGTTSSVAVFSNGSGNWTSGWLDTSVPSDDAAIAFVDGTAYVAYHGTTTDSTRLALGGCSATGDAQDENCDGLDGVDADHDGHGDAAFLGADCDDTNVGVNPGAADPYGDARDANCDHADGVDADHDRFGAKVGSTGTDCNDSDPFVSPAAFERCNAIDDECDGLTDATDPQLTGHDQQSCEKQAALCAGSTKPSRLCVAGAWQPCDDAAYEQHTSQYDPLDLGGDRCITWVSGGSEKVAAGVNASASLAYDSTGAPHVVYRMSGAGGLLFASKNAAGGWSSVTIDTAGDWPSLAVFNGEYRVAYRRTTTTGVYLARSADGTTWTTEKVDGTSGAGLATLLRVDRYGNDHVAYVDGTAGQSKYAVRVRGNWVVSTLGLAETGSPVLGLAVDADQHVHACIETAAGDLVYSTNRTGSLAGTVLASGGFKSCDLELDAYGGVHVAFANATIPAALTYAKSTTGWQAQQIYLTNGNINMSPDLLIYDRQHAAIAFFGGNAGLPWSLLTMRNTTGAWVVDGDVPAQGIGTPQGRLQAAWRPDLIVAPGTPLKNYGIVFYHSTDGQLVYAARDCDDYSWSEDENCDGVDGIDSDGDGVASRATYGADCDDTDDRISPNRRESCDDLDNDCNGFVDEYASESTTKEAAAALGSLSGDVGQAWDQSYLVAMYNASKRWAVTATRPKAGASGAWTQATLDSTADRGLLIALTVDPWNGLHAAYRDATLNQLVYAYRPAGSTTVTTSVVGPINDTCASVSIAVDAFGVPHVSYQDLALLADQPNLVHAWLGATGWSTEVVDGSALNKSGTYSSIRLRDGVTPVIAFYRDSSADAVLAIRDAGVWTTRKIETTGTTGAHIALALGAGGYHVAYQNGSGKLRWAWAAFENPSVWTGALVDPVKTSNGISAQIEIDALDTLHVLTRQSGALSSVDYWTRPLEASAWTKQAVFDEGTFAGTLGLAVDRASLWPLATWGRGDSANLWFGTLQCK